VLIWSAQICNYCRMILLLNIFLSTFSKQQRLMFRQYYWLMYSAFGKSLCTYKRCWEWCPRVSIQAWTRLISFANAFSRSVFRKSLCTYKRCWEWCPWGSVLYNMYNYALYQYWTSTAV
jgi:hypothetical protein